MGRVRGVRYIYRSISSGEIKDDWLDSYADIVVINNYDQLLSSLDSGSVYT